MAGIDRLISFLPASYDFSEGSTNRAVLGAFGASLDALDEAIQGFKNNRYLETATGSGLNRAAENYSVTRPPGMTDARFRSLAQKLASGRRLTLFAIKDVFEAATGYTDVLVEDYQSYTGDRPALFEIRITIPSAQAVGFGRGYYPGFSPTNKDGYPVESGIVGTVIDEHGFAGGLFNDHFWSLVDAWTLAIMDKVRAAGTFYSITQGPPPVPPSAYWKFDEGTGTLAEDTATGGSSRDGTLQAAAGWNTAAGSPPALLTGRQVLELDGTSTSWVNTPAYSLGGALSFSAWFYPLSVVSDRFIVGFQTYNADFLLLYTSGTNIIFQTAVSGSALTVSSVISTGNWYHVAATVDGSGNLELYLNGSSVGTLSGTVPGTATRTQHDIGRSFQYANPFVGQMAEIAQWTGTELDSGQVGQLWAGGAGMDANNLTE